MKTVFGAFAIALCLQGYSQSSWNKKNYETVNTSNFRTFEAFKNSIDTLHIDYALLNACLYFTINEQRLKKNLPIVPHHISLETSAYFHSKKMAEFSFYSHDNTKDTARATTGERGKLAGIKNPVISECIYARAFVQGLTYLSLCEDFTEGWMESKGHHDIIIDKDNISFGAGIFYKGNDYFGFRGTLNFQCCEAIKYFPKTAIDLLPY